MTATPSRKPSGLVFMGTPAFAATILAALVEAGYGILAVYTPTASSGWSRSSATTLTGAIGGRPT